MSKYFTGLITGMLLVLGLHVYANDDWSSSKQAKYFEEMTNIAKNLKAEHGNIWYSATTNLKLQKEKLPDPVFNAPETPEDYPLLSLASADPLKELTINDIQRVCLAYINDFGDTHAFAVAIFLKPDARRDVGNILAKRDDQIHSFRLFGVEGDRFIVDAAKARRFAEKANLYPDKNTMNSSIEDDTALFELDPDMTFFFPKTAAYFGLTLAKYANGSNDLTGCTSDDNVNDATGYKEHYEYWENWQELYAKTNSE